MLLFLFLGLFLLRFVHRAFSRLLFQEPPRSTSGRTPLKDRFAEYPFPQPICLSVSRVRYPTLNTLVHVFKCNCALLVTTGKPLQTTPHPEHVVLGEKPMVGKNAKAEKSNTFADPIDPAFPLMEFEAKPAEILPHPPVHLLKPLPIRAERDKIVHIADIKSAF